MIKILLAFIFLLLVGCVPEIEDPENTTIQIPVNCTTTVNGYECEYDEGEYDQLQVINADEQLKAKCEADGGRYKCYGFCLDRYPRFCDFPYEDAGKSCTDMDECQGFCLADDFECKTGCTGTCATYRVNMCDNPTYLTNGTSNYISVLCD